MNSTADLFKTRVTVKTGEDIITYELVLKDNELSEPNVVSISKEYSK